MSNSNNSNSERQEQAPEHGRQLVRAKITEVYGNGHDGKLKDEFNTEHVFETTHGMLVKVGDAVIASIQTQTHGNLNANEHRNSTHGGPKALVVSGGDTVPPGH